MKSTDAYVLLWRIHDSNRTVKNLYLLLFISIFFFSCTKNNNFQGNLEFYIDDASEVSLLSTEIELDSIYSSFFYVIDSMAIFYNDNGDKAFDIVKFGTRGKIGSFCSRGRGHKEFLSLSPIFQIYQNQNEKKGLLFAPNESKLLIWNITESIRKDSTIYDNIILYSWRDKSPVAFCNQYIIGEDSVLLYFPSVTLSSEDRIINSYYQIRTLKDNKLLTEINIFDHPIDNKESKVLPSNFFNVFSSLKPDRSKLVEVMTRLPQINILNIKTGKVSGYRMKNTQDEDVFLTDMENSLFCYCGVVTDNKYIYALWIGSPQNDIPIEKGYNIIHVFDWDGNLVRKIKLEQPVHRLSLDNQRSILYGWNIERHKLYKYDLLSLKK